MPSLLRESGEVLKLPAIWQVSWGHMQTEGGAKTVEVTFYDEKGQGVEEAYGFALSPEDAERLALQMVGAARSARSENAQ